MRWNEEQVQPEKKPKKEDKKDIPVKAGSKDYDYGNLSSTKKILTGRGSV